jgi:hypothetical protein
MDKPIIDDEFLLQKMSGKGGWTFAVVPVSPHIRRNGSLWIRVIGIIDGHEFKKMSLAPLKDGRFFIPFKAEVRKVLEKGVGDYVKIVLFEDLSAFVTPAEIIDCLKIEIGAYEKFMQFKENHRFEFINWIYSAKKEETQAQRINIMIDKVLRGERLYVKKEE